MPIDLAKPDSAADLKTLNKVALTLAKYRKVFRDGEITKECTIKTPLTFGNNKLAKNFENMSLFHQTVARRVAELSDKVILQLKEVFWQHNYFSLAFDESTNISDISQLLI